MRKVIQTKEVLKEWNSFLIKESNADRVKRMIDDLESFGKQIHITEPSKSVIVITYGKNYTSGNRDASKNLFGQIRCSDTSASYDDKQKGIGAGETNSCWEVDLTSHTTKGMGPLLYEVLIEYISNIKRASLKPDASSVSDLAKNVWNKFNDRPQNDVKKIQLDVGEKTVYRFKRYKNQDVKQLTPDNVEDDTMQDSSIRDKGFDAWEESALSKAYKKLDMPIIDELKARNLIIMPKTFKSKLGSAWG
jgi:hypothetical protein